MSNTGLDVFDKTLQITNHWFNEIMEEVGPNRQVAWKVLNAVLHKLRDRLTVDLAAHLGAQLPMLVRGAYYDQYEPSRQPERWSSMQEFIAEVNQAMSGIRPTDPRLAIAAVFGVLSRHLAEGQIVTVRDSLPKAVRSAWEELDARREAAAAEA